MVEVANLFWRLALYITWYTLQVITSVLLIRLDELVEISLTPASETLQNIKWTIIKSYSNCSLVSIKEGDESYKCWNKFQCAVPGSNGGRVVKLLACGARGPGFDSPPRHLNFQRLVISCFQVEIWLKDRQIDVNQKQPNQPKCAVPSERGM